MTNPTHPQAPGWREALEEVAKSAGYGLNVDMAIMAYFREADDPEFNGDGLRPAWPRFAGAVTSALAEVDFLQEMLDARNLDCAELEQAAKDLDLKIEDQAATIDRLSAALAEKENSGPQTPVQCDRPQEASSPIPAPSASGWRGMESAPRDAPILIRVDGVAHQADFHGPSDGAIYSKSPSRYNWLSQSTGGSVHDDDIDAWAPLPAESGADDRADLGRDTGQNERDTLLSALAEAEGALKVAKRDFMLAAKFVPPEIASALSTIQRARGTEG